MQVVKTNSLSGRTQLSVTAHCSSTQLLRAEQDPDYRDDDGWGDVVAPAEGGGDQAGAGLGAGHAALPLLRLSAVLLHHRPAQAHGAQPDGDPPRPAPDVMDK